MFDDLKTSGFVTEYFWAFVYDSMASYTSIYDLRTLYVTLVIQSLSVPIVEKANVYFYLLPSGGLDLQRFFWSYRCLLSAQHDDVAQGKIKVNI